jgi:hypothetical protein
VARVRLATAKKSGTKARTISAASARTIWSLSPDCGNERDLDGFVASEVPADPLT